MNNLFLREQGFASPFPVPSVAGEGRGVPHSSNCSEVVARSIVTELNILLQKHVRDCYNTDTMKALFSLSGCLMVS